MILQQVKKIKLTKEIWSKCQLQIIKYNNFSLVKNKKLFPNISNKRKYKTPLSNLETLSKFRVTIKKFNGALEFNQEP